MVRRTKILAVVSLLCAGPVLAEEAAQPRRSSKVAPGEEASLMARAELVVGQTAHGIAQGVMLCGAAACNGQGYAGATLLGGLVGGGAAFLLGEGFSGGPASAINNGSAWGFAQGLMLAGLLQPSEVPNIFGLLSVSTLAGTGLGAGLGLLLSPTGGQVAMTSSGGMWSSALTGLMLGAFAPGLDGKVFAGILLASANAGLLALGFTSSVFPVSRARMFLIDTGGVLGGLAGFAVATVFAAGSQAANPMIAAGILGGLVLGTLGTAGLEESATPLAVSFSPVGPNGSAGATMGLRF